MKNDGASGFRLSGARKSAAIAAGFVIVFASNLTGALDAWAKPFAKDFDYWHASRVIGSGDTINEFPFFTFFHADLHPHLLAFPFFLAAFFSSSTPRYPRRPEAAWSLRSPSFDQ